MGGLFGGGGGGDGGAAQRQLDMQKENVAKEEARVLQDKTKLAEQKQASLKTRSRGGMRPLLAMYREDPELGVKDSSKLGGSGTA